jgi:hypothetical protein
VRSFIGIGPLSAWAAGVAALMIEKIRLTFG